MVAIVCKTLKNAKSSGVWPLLEKMLKIWEGYTDFNGVDVPGCPGFKVLEGPKTTGDTKMSFVRILNRHGTISEIQCHSLEHAQEVEAKFKGSAYSLFWLSEFDQYCDEHAFDIFCDALRMWPGIKFEEHQIICDCNPPDTGTNNWMHDKWFKFKDATPMPDEPQSDAILRSYLHRLLVMIDDNLQLDPRQRAELEARYRKRKTHYNRFVLGIWEQDLTDGHFSDVWDDGVHVIGRADCVEEEREVIVPTQACVSLLCGWDIGESKNHSFHILEKVVTEDQRTKRGIVSFSIIDELVVIRTYISVREYVEAALDKMEHWSEYHKKHHNVEIKFRHWSDTSAFQKRSAAEASDAAIVYESSNGRIVLEGAPKYRNSRRDRVKLVWQLLYEKRLFVSAQLFKTRTMFANLRQGSTATEFIREDEHKHPFDSLSYPIIAEAPMDMLRSSDIVAERKQQSPGLIMAGL